MQAKKGHSSSKGIAKLCDMSEKSLKILALSLFSKHFWSRLSSLLSGMKVLIGKSSIKFWCEEVDLVKMQKRDTKNSVLSSEFPLQ